MAARKQPPKTRATLVENRNGKTVTTIERLAVLTEQEQASIAQGIAMVNDAEARARFMRVALNAIWAQIQQTYDLPEAFGYNPETGEVTPSQT